jgi:hypothetical protein
VELIAPTNHSAGIDFLLNGFPWRIYVLSDAGHDHPIKALMNITRGHQIRKTLELRVEQSITRGRIRRIRQSITAID